MRSNPRPVLSRYHALVSYYDERCPRCYYGLGLPRQSTFSSIGLECDLCKLKYSTPVFEDDKLTIRPRDYQERNNLETVS